MATAASQRLGKMDSLVVRILRDIILMMDDDPYLDAFEELVPGPELNAAGDLEDDAEEVWMTDLDRVESQVLKRVAGALTHYATNDKGDRLVRELHRQLGAEDETQEEEHRIILIHAPEAHLVRQV